MLSLSVKRRHRPRYADPQPGSSSPSQPLHRVAPTGCLVERPDRVAGRYQSRMADNRYKLCSIGLSWKSLPKVRVRISTISSDLQIALV